MKQLETNEYLCGLKRLFDEYGVTQVRTNRTPKSDKFTSIFYLTPDVVYDVKEALMEYMSTDDDSIFASIDNESGNPIPEGCFVFYKDGVFYGEE